MKIAHLTVVRKLTAGQQQQLIAEHLAAGQMDSDRWETLVLEAVPSTLPFSRQIPRVFRGLFLRNLYGWWVACRLAKENDLILVRHMTFDPFAFIFAPLIPNRISVHHAKEVEELRLVRCGWRGRCASTLERWTGAFGLRRVLAIAGVTAEIANYQNERTGTSKPVFVYSNGLNSNDIGAIRDRRDPKVVNVAFVCGTFSPWHGLDKLMAAVLKAGDNAMQDFRVHLIGNLFLEQMEEIRRNDVLREVFVVHGHLARDQYESILEQCDAGLASFALERKGLTEASTLKVREMLGAGIPVYSGHADVAFDPNGTYTVVDRDVDAVKLRNFAFNAKKIAREVIVGFAARHVDKKCIMTEFIYSLKGVVAD